MKKVEAIVRKEKFYDIKAQLDEAGVKGFTSYEVKGLGNQKGETTSSARKSSFKANNPIQKTKIEVVCADDELFNTVSAIARAAQTGSVGDGKIFISDIMDVVRIRTEEHGEDVV